MAELRFNPLTKDWVMIASHRQNRPQMPKDWCPFCPNPDNDKIKERWKKREKRAKKRAQKYAPKSKPEIVSSSRDYEKRTPKTTTKEGVFTAFSKEEVKIVGYTPSFVKTTKPTSKEKTEFIRIIYTPMGNKR
mgnify:CR=1 FL=1